MRYRWEDCEVDTTRFELHRDGELVHVEPQVFDVLSHLLAQRDRVVSKVDLLESVWGDRFVSESALTTRVKQLRRAVGDDGRRQRVVRTVHGRGYQFVADVTEEDGDVRPPLEPTAADLDQEIRFCRTSDDVRLGYALVGEGPPLVRAAHWITHLDYDWQSPVWHHWLVGLARHHTFVRYDERGCGLSDHDPGDMSMDAWVRDLETVVDQLELERFPLLGVSQGGALAIAYAARHPERVSHLVLYGAYLHGRRRRTRSPEELRAAELQLEMVRVGWGRDDPAFRRFFAADFMPDASKEMWEAFAELVRRTTSVESATRMLEAWSDIDVAEEAAAVRAPTLVLHCRDDLRVPFEQGRQIAALIPGARFVPLEGRNHLLLADEPAWAQFLDELEAFVP